MAYYLAEGAIVKGDVTIGEDSGIWYHATVRGDTEKITIGSRTNIQDNAVLHVGAGHFNGIMLGGIRISDACQHICYCIGDLHAVSSFANADYQLAFLTPGISPLWASSRKHIRQMPNLRR